MRLLLALALAATSLAAQPAGKSHLDFRREAEAAYQRKDYDTALAATREALALRPDSPRYLHNLAALSVLTGDNAAALDYLRRLAALGVVTPIERDPDLAPLQGTPEFLRIVQQLAAHREPRGEAQVIAELPGVVGIIEGIVFRPKTGDFLLSDVHHRCIWRRTRDSELVRFTAEDEALFGLFGLAVDEPRNALWAAMSAVPEMAGFEPDMKGHAGLAEFDLRTGELRRIVPVPIDGRDHGLGDLVVAPDGTVYATDSKSPIIWKYVPGAEDIEIAFDSPVFSSLQGLILERTTLVVADYSHGLFVIDLPTGNITPLAPPEGTTLLGIDGLVALPGGAVATQNGTTPQRLLHLTFTPEFDKITSVKVLAAALSDMTDLALLTLADDRPTFIAGAGWDAFDSSKTKPPPARTVRLFQAEVQP